MFKIGSFEEELMKSMNHQMMANEAEEIHGFQKLSKAVDLLAAAAELLEHSGLTEESDDITSILEKL